MLDGLQRMEESETPLLSPRALARGQLLKGELCQRVAILEEAIRRTQSGEPLLDGHEYDFGGSSVGGNGGAPTAVLVAAFKHWLADTPLTLPGVIFWIGQLRERLRNEEALCRALDFLSVSKTAGTEHYGSLAPDDDQFPLPSDGQRWKTTEKSWQQYLAQARGRLLEARLSDLENFFPAFLVDPERKQPAGQPAINGTLQVRVLGASLGPEEERPEETLVVQVWVDSRVSAPLKLKRTGEGCDLIKSGIRMECKQAGTLDLLVFDKGANLRAFAFFRLAWLEAYMGTTFDRTLRDQLHLIPSGSIDVAIRLTRSSSNGIPENTIREEDGGVEEAPGPLTRRRAIKRKIHAHLGHEFVTGGRQSALIMKCAHCGDFIYAKIGVKCRKCRFTCHKDCISEVYIRCLADANYEQWEEMTEALIRGGGENGNGNGNGENYGSREHSYEPASVRTPTFCAHCGRLVPIGGGGGGGGIGGAIECVKCRGTTKLASFWETDLGVDCGGYWHEECQMYAPPFCGLRRKDAIRLARPFLEKYEASAIVPESPVTSASEPPLMSPTLASPAPKCWPAFHEDDFEFLNVIGKGNFGKVMLVRHRDTGQLLALKILKKTHIVENDEVDSVVAEQRVLSLVRQEAFPFLVACQGVFENQARLFFVMEFVGGGDLMFHIQGKRFSEEEARYLGQEKGSLSPLSLHRFLAAEVLLALEFLHKRGIIYRDLKLDNILLAWDGHIKLADYGLCKFGVRQATTGTSTFCGTPEFMAPEILQERPYGQAVDWWAYGVLLYELLLWQAPFHGPNEQAVFKSILTAKIGFPRPISAAARDLIQKLLVRNPAYRLGSHASGGNGLTGAEAIKKHPFFAPIDWSKLLAKRIDPPFKPAITNPADVSNFEKQFISEKPLLTPLPSTVTVPPSLQSLFTNLTVAPSS